jgi:clan AA aspartic protease
VDTGGRATDIQEGAFMGITFVDGTVRGPDGRIAEVRFLVDSGALYTLLPYEVWRAIGLAATRTMRFSLADGTQVVRDIGECHITLPQGQGHTPVILGEPGDTALLGAVTLEIFGLVLNPFTRELQPIRAMLAAAAPGRG